MKKLVFAACLLLSACYPRRVPVSTAVPQNNQTYKVDFLFEHDGCRVYRFQDMGAYVYFTSCNGETARIEADSSATRTTKSINQRKQ